MYIAGYSTRPWVCIFFYAYPMHSYPATATAEDMLIRHTAVDGWRQDFSFARNPPEAGTLACLQPTLSGCKSEKMGLVFAHGTVLAAIFFPHRSIPLPCNTVAPLTADERSLRRTAIWRCFLTVGHREKRSLFKRGIASRGSWVATV